MAALEAAKRLVPVAEPDIGERELAYVTEAVKSGWVSSAGPFVERFEREFASFCEVKHAVAVSNGTVALHLALVARGIGPGDEVVVPSLTFAATAATVRHAGATPVFVESREDSWCMDPEAVEAAVGPATKAIIAVHLYGHPADMDRLRAIASKHGLFLLEDAAEAHGAKYKGRRTGSLGDAACFSFYGNKIMTSGEGGMVVTDDDALVRRMRMLKDHGMDPERKYWHTAVGYNYRMTNLQAAIGCAQLERLPELQAGRQRVVDAYRKALAGSGVVVNPHLAGAEPAPWMACAVLAAPGERDAAMARLRAAGFDSRPFFGLLHEMPPYQSSRYVGGQAGGKVDERLSRGGMNLPSSARLGPEQIAAVVATLLERKKGSA